MLERNNCLFSSFCISLQNSFSMSVLLETSLGDMVVDLEAKRIPINTANFIHLAQLKRFNNMAVSKIDENFICIFGQEINDPGSAEHILGNTQIKFCPRERHERIKNSRMGTVGSVNGGEAFYITLRDGPLPHLDQGDTAPSIIGYVEEGLEILEKINLTLCDTNKKPFNTIRIRHSVILDDAGLDAQKPSWFPNQLPASPIEIFDEKLEAVDDLEDEKVIAEREKEALARAQEVELELMGDLPSADIRPPINVLFVCQLNPVTEDEDLKTVFSRFGEIIKCEIIRDYKTGDSLQYAFVEFKEESACNKAYVAMQNVLIDDKRIKVDFSQSVSKIWNNYRRQGKAQKSNGDRHNVDSRDRDRHLINHDRYDYKSRRSRSRDR